MHANRRKIIWRKKVRQLFGSIRRGNGVHWNYERSRSTPCCTRAYCFVNRQRSYACAQQKNRVYFLLKLIFFSSRLRPASVPRAFLSYILACLLVFSLKVRSVLINSFSLFHNNFCFVRHLNVNMLCAELRCAMLLSSSCSCQCAQKTRTHCEQHVPSTLKSFHSVSSTFLSEQLLSSCTSRTIETFLLYPTHNQTLARGSIAAQCPTFNVRRCRCAPECVRDSAHKIRNRTRALVRSQLCEKYNDEGSINRRNNQDNCRSWPSISAQIGPQLLGLSLRKEKEQVKLTQFGQDADFVV